MFIYATNTERQMMTNEFHKPFIRSLIVIGFTTLIAMISTKYIIEAYASSLPVKNVEYSASKPNE